MTSGEGNISAVGLHARQLDADTSEGDVDLGFAIPPGRVTASSAEGSITIELPRGPASYQVLAGTAEGNVSTTVNEDSTSQRVIRARSAEGDVTVAYHEKTSGPGQDLPMSGALLTTCQTSHRRPTGDVAEPLATERSFDPRMSRLTTCALFLCSRRPWRAEEPSP